MNCPYCQSSEVYDLSVLSKPGQTMRLLTLQSSVLGYYRVSEKYFLFPEYITIPAVI